MKLPCSASAEVEFATLSIVQAIREIEARFPHQVLMSFESFFAQEREITSFLAECVGGNGFAIVPDVGSISRFTVAPDARYVSLQRGTYRFKDQAWAKSFELFFCRSTHAHRLD